MDKPERTGLTKTMRLVEDLAYISWSCEILVFSGARDVLIKEQCKSNVS